MDSLNKYLSSKVKNITWSLYSFILFWTTKLAFPLKNNPKQHHRSNNKSCLKVGLKTLVHSEEKLPPRILHRYNMGPKPPSPPPSPRLLSKSLWLSPSPAFQYTMMGDVIGAESGDCMTSDIMNYEELNAIPESEPPATYSKLGRSMAREKRQFPPPMTCPWSFKREYSEDGRLIITAEKTSLSEEEEEEEEEDDDDVVYCEECGYPINEEELVAMEASNLSQKSSFEKESVPCWDLRECVTYAGASGLDRVGDANHYLGRPGSAPIRPMTPVM